MNTNTVLGLLAVVLLVGANGFFVAVEFALVAIDRARVAMGAEEGTRPWPTVMNLLQRLSFHLSGAQLGITISSLLLGFLTKPVAAALLTPALEPLIGAGAVEGVGIAIAVLLATLLQILFGELVPKTVAIADPDRVMKWLAKPAAAYGLAAGPAIGVCNTAANRITERMGVEVVDELHSISSLQELEQVIRSSEAVGKIDERNMILLTRSIRFSDKTAADILVPRVDITAIEVGKSVADLAFIAVESGHSRFVVIDEDLDDIVGIVHVKSVHSVAVSERATTPVASLMTDVLAVPEALDLESLLVEMRRTRHQLAVVVDEHGGTEGIVTLEDIVEEIVGEIDDEYDPDPEESVVVEQNAFVLNGSMHPDEVEEATGFVMPEGDFETLAGFALDQIQRIPTTGEVFEYEGWRFEVAEMDNRRIASLRLNPLNPLPRDSQPRGGAR